MMYCENCGNKIPDTSQFCSFCGNKVNQVVSSPKQSIPSFLKVNSNSSIRSNRGSSKSSVPIGAICLIIAVIITLVALYSDGIRIWKCDECGKVFFGKAYYIDMDYDTTVCKDCAESYWYPFPYQNYRK